MSGATPLIGLVAVTGLAGLLIVIFKVRCEYILALHVFGRVVLDSVPKISYAQHFGGISPMQIYSVLWIVVFVGYLVYICRGRILLPKITLAVVLLIVSCALASVINLNFGYFLDTSLKWFYLFSLVLFCINTLRRSNVRKYCLLLLIAGIYPLLNQVLAAAVMGPKISHGIVNYIGTYYHEAGFSSLILLLIALSLALFSLFRSTAARGVLGVMLAVSYLSIAMAGYRTALLAAVVLIVVYLFFQSQRSYYRLSLFAVAAITACMALAWMAMAGHLDQFRDIARFLSDPGKYLDFSGGGGDREILTGRIYLLNRIMRAYLNADLFQKLAGLGPGIAQESIGVYAHNEFISALTEFGLIGLGVFIYFHVRMVHVCFMAMRRHRDLAHLSLSVIVAIVVLSIATMPYHDMRALLLLGIIYSIADFQSRRGVREEPAAAERRRTAVHVDAVPSPLRHGALAAALDEQRS